MNRIREYSFEAQDYEFTSIALHLLFKFRYPDNLIERRGEERKDRCLVASTDMIALDS